MSGPVDQVDPTVDHLGSSAIEVREGRSTTIGTMGIVRILPTKRRRAIGPWCFVDLMSPDDIENPPPLEIGPHPHIGLATVTWLFAGAALHSDSLGTAQVIRPGELNLMTAGHGIAHAELGVETAAAPSTGGFIGAQMWLAQTEATRHQASGFEHLDEVPVVDLGTGEARILIGGIQGETSPANVDHPTIGLDLTIAPGVEIPTDPRFEHGVVPIDRPLRIEEVIVEPGSLAIVPTGTEALRIAANGGTARLLLLGGEPLGVEIKMWWNFVARTQEELTSAWRDWAIRNDDRFGPVPSQLDRIEAPTPPWIRPAD